jgi:hypothetical protein
VRSCTSWPAQGVLAAQRLWILGKLEGSEVVGDFWLLARSPQHFLHLFGAKQLIKTFQQSAKRLHTHEFSRERPNVAIHSPQLQTVFGTRQPTLKLSNLQHLPDFNPYTVYA